MDEQVQWRGWPRWGGFAIALFMIVSSSIPIFMGVNDPAMGWGIFLGVFLFGAIAAGHPKAPTVAFVICFVWGLGALLSLLAESALWVVQLAGLVGIIAVTVGLRRQADELGL